MEVKSGFITATASCWIATVTAVTLNMSIKVRVKVTFTLEQATKAQRGEQR
jgi:hypothetical protein